MPDNERMASIVRAPLLSRRPLQREYAFILPPSSPFLHQVHTPFMSSEAATEDEHDNSPLPALDLASASMLIPAIFIL
jgi:hypothetical protein